MYVCRTEKKKSSLVVDDQPFVPNLLLQGVKKDLWDQDFLSRYQCMIPTTVIDIELRKVHRTELNHRFNMLRCEYILETINLATTTTTTTPTPTLTASSQQVTTTTPTPSVTSLPLSSGNGVHPAVVSAAIPPVVPSQSKREDLFELKEPAPFILEMVTFMNTLPTSLQHGYLISKLRCLTRSAVIIIQYIEARLKTEKSLKMDVVNKIMSMLDISSENDFLLLLGIAEQLRPGIYYDVVGEPDAIAAKFYSLLETF